ncbi:MAG: cation:dicarboxylase symporter family transporter [Candidatus Aminicenantes bacterium]|nr:cation:dicarboxylase symporter family transporter [Candidatus Aminicenantes bacterium]
MSAKKKNRLTLYIFIGMGLGLLIGALFPQAGTQLRPLSLIFIRLIKTIIAPLIFATIVVGIAGHSDLKAVGRMGGKALIYFEIVTTIALFLGLAFVNITKPGVGVVLHGGDISAIAAKPQKFADVLIHIFPQSFFQAAAEGDVLQVVVFSIIFALALSMVHGKKKAILDVCESLAETMFKFTSIIMRFAPIGVGAAIAVAVGSKGLSVLVNLGLLILTFYACAVSFVLLVFIPVMLIFKVPVRKFFSAVKEPALIAFSTTSSEAALPKAMQAMEGMGVPREIVAFILPTGYSFNLDGTSLYLSMASVFVAQAAGVHMTFGQQLVMVFTLMLTSKGVAGVPRACLVILAGTLASFNLPIEGVAILLGIDELVDMVRTTINVIGNCLASVVVARWEGKFIDDPPPLPEA